MDRVYVDNNATTPVAPEVLKEMLPYLEDLYANPSSMYSFAGEVAEKLKEARARVAGLLGADPEEIVFTSCGSESDSTAIWAAVNANPDKRHIITTRVEHPAVKNQGHRRQGRSRIPGNVGQGEDKQRLGQKLVSDFGLKPGVDRDPPNQADLDRSVTADLMHGR